MTSDPDRNQWAQGFKSNPIAVTNRANASRTMQNTVLLTLELSQRSSCAERAELAADNHGQR